MLWKYRYTTYLKVLRLLDRRSMKWIEVLLSLHTMRLLHACFRACWSRRTARRIFRETPSLGEIFQGIELCECHLKSSFFELTDISISLLFPIHIYICCSNRTVDIVIFLRSIVVRLKKFVRNNFVFSIYGYIFRQFTHEMAERQQIFIIL